MVTTLYGLENISFKPSVSYATTGALPSYSDTSGVLTATANGALPDIDGIVPSVGDRVLVKNETGGNAPHNGIFVVTQVGSASAPWILSRSPDMNFVGQFPGALAFVMEGTVNGGNVYVIESAGPFVFGTTAVTWTLLGNVAALSNPMTTAGDTIAGGSGGSPQRIAGDTSNTRKFLRTQSVSGVAQEPAWDTLATGDIPQLPDYAPAGLTGATHASRYVGATTSGAPTSGTFAVGDFVIDRSGTVWICTAAGAPGTWTSPSGLTNPMTGNNDLIIGGVAGAPTRLAPGGANGYLLQMIDGAVGWGQSLGMPLDGPSAAHPTVFQQPDGSVLVLPLAYYSLSGDDSTWINAAFTYLPVIAGGSGSYGGSYNGPWITGTIYLAPAVYTITAGIVAPVNEGATVNIIGHPAGGTVLMVGSGAVGLTSHVAMGGPQGGPPARQNMATYRGLRFDGTNGGLVGVEIGGGWGRHIDISCVNFNTASGCIGFHINNATNSYADEWTEKCRISVDLMMNTTSCVIEQTAGSSGADSCEYNDIDLYIIASNSATYNGPGLLLRGGAYLSGGSLRIRGNFATNSGPVVMLTGHDSSSGNYSSIYKQFVDITVESAATSNIPQTIGFGSSNNNFNNNVGILSFKFVNFTPSNVSNSAGQFTMKGLIDGDVALLEAASNVNTPAVPAANAAKTNNQNIDVIAYVAGGSGVNVTVDGVATGLGSGAFHVPNQGTVGLGNYTGSPSWTWVGVV